MKLTNKQRTVKLLDRTGNVVQQATFGGWDTDVTECMNHFAGAELDLVRPDDGDGDFEYDNNSVIHSLAFREDTSEISYNDQHIGTLVVESTADVE